LFIARFFAVLFVVGPIIGWFIPPQYDDKIDAQIFMAGIWFLVILLLAMLVGNVIAVIEFSEMMSLDLLEHSAHDKIQDALKSSWTNTALLAALLFTIVAAYGFPYDGELELRHFPLPREYSLFFESTEMSTHVYGAYAIIISIAFWEYLIAMLTATVHLMFTDGLSVEDAREYVHANPSSPASPIVWLVCGSVWHALATLILFQTTNEFGYFFIVVGAVAMLVLYVHIREAAGWAPEAKKGLPRAKTLQHLISGKESPLTKAASSDGGAAVPGGIPAERIVTKSL
jgi:NADH:ubiquinone oxidoreductase subunit 6 (subunit J)